MTSWLENGFEIQEKLGFSRHCKKKGYANPEKMTDKDTEFLDIPMMIKDDDDTVRKGENDGTYFG